MAAIPNSILDTTKKILGIDPEVDVFDVDIVTHINSTFSTLQQLGVGPEEGFEIEDNTKLWTDFLGTNKKLNSVKSYMYMKVRQQFDPPATSFALTAMEKLVLEAEWRLQVAAESDLLKFEDDGSLSDIYDDDPIPANQIIWEIDENEGFPPEVTAKGVVGFDPKTGNVWRTY